MGDRSEWAAPIEPVGLSDDVEFRSCNTFPAEELTLARHFTRRRYYCGGEGGGRAYAKSYFRSA